MFYTLAIQPLPYRVDGKIIHLPYQYGFIRLIDFTSWIDIPPRFNISASSPVEIRPGDTQAIEIVPEIDSRLYTT